MSVNYFFGVKALIFYRPETLKPVGVFRVISSVELAREIEKLPLTGGHRNGAWAVEAGEPTNTLTATLREFPDFAFTELDNATKTETLGEDVTGFVGAITNKVGVSISNATTGIASVSVTSGGEAKVPLGKIVLVATAVANEVDVYLLGDVASGTLPVVNELTLLASGVIIPDLGGTVDIADYGITLTGGSGTVALVEDDTAFFESRPANSKTTQILLEDESQLKNLGVILVYPKNSAKQQRIIDFPKVSVGGIPFAGNTREFAEFEFTGTPLLDDTNNQLYTKTEIIATN